MNKKLSLFTLIFASMILISPVIAEVSVTNGYYTVYIDNGIDGGEDGTFTIGTGALHPFPGESVLYDGDLADAWSSEFVIKFYSLSGDEYYTSGLIPYFHGITTDTNSMTETWELGEDFFSQDVLDQSNDSQIPNPFIISRTFTVYGDSYESSYVGIETTFTNNTTSTVSFGFLDMWDLEIYASDDAIMRTIGPLSQWSGMFRGWYPPTFSALEVTDLLPPHNHFSVFIPFVENDILPTVPDEFIYGEWSQVGDWGYVPTGGPSDSGVAFIFGASETNSITLAPGESEVIVQCISTNAEALDIVIPTGDVGPASFIPLYKVKLRQVTEMWECILSNLPEELSDEHEQLIDSVQTFMNGAITLTNPIYANGQLAKALEKMSQIEEAFDIHCIEK